MIFDDLGHILSEVFVDYTDKNSQNNFSELDVSEIEKHLAICAACLESHWT
jgi:hypothetical protein